MSMFSVLVLGGAIAAVYFAVVWAISVRVKNYGFLDVAWSYAIAVLAPLYAALGDGFAPRKWTLTFIGAAWSLRLGTHVLARVLKHHPAEDPRYKSLREKWPTPSAFFFFFELQALIAVILSLPFLFVAYDTRAEISVLQIVGFVIAAVALLGEATADSQIKRFVADPANKGKVCRVGLWRYSRHPNYFFESLVWWGFFLAALSSPWGWVTLICPLMMLWFLLFITGIALTEKHSIESKGDAYREYQRTTSPFIPWFPKHP